MAADRIKLAEPAPPYCSSCFSQKPQKAHVDFGAAWDGPVVQGDGVVQHVIDDLVICEDCLHKAGLLVGLGDVTAVGAELQRAERENDELLEQIRGLRAYVTAREEAESTRPAFLDEAKPQPKPETKRRAKAAA